jgi:uncharacterized protein YndB with AHSA1/START domain
MARYTFSTVIKAPVDVVFDLWTNVDRMGEWVGGVTRVSDRSGPIDASGTTYTVWFGRMKSRTEVIDVERPNRFATRFGNQILKGRNIATFEATGAGTRLTQTFETQGIIAAIAARLFATGSYRGSFRGELEAFARLAEASASASPI